jgi:chemotaxis protein MotB
LVSYADFVTLLMCFFLILWASANPDPQRFSELAIAFNKTINSGAMLGQAGTGQIIGKGGRMGQIEISPFQRVTESAGELATQMGLSDQVSVGMKKEGLVITISGSLLFDAGKADVRPEAVDVLARLASIIEPAAGEIRIEGHSDNIPIATAEYPSNWELSSRRAASVLRYFTETMGLPAERFQVAGYAEFRPIVPNDTRENRAKNRRVEIILLTPQIAPLAVSDGPLSSVDATKPAAGAPAPPPAAAKPAAAAKPTH